MSKAEDTLNNEDIKSNLTVLNEFMLAVLAKEKDGDIEPLKKFITDFGDMEVIVRPADHELIQQVEQEQLEEDTKYAKQEKKEKKKKKEI
ncbi:MAG: hypothetical protein DRJ64_00695 [Thermoprotei archaeon]|nr:MAG: hypothetical protein DRJ64_00695 [Thermoprotei archaeon]